MGIFTFLFLGFGIVLIGSLIFEYVQLYFFLINSVEIKGTIVSVISASRRIRVNDSLDRSFNNNVSLLTIEFEDEEGNVFQFRPNKMANYKYDLNDEVKINYNPKKVNDFLIDSSYKTLSVGGELKLILIGICFSLFGLFYYFFDGKI